MKVRLYKTFSKRKNSTKQPGVSDSYTEVDVKLKEFTSVKNPAFALNTTDFTFEYAYIPTWNRYYFVADQISINATTTEYTLEEDVLATNKAAIGSTVARIAFSSTGYDKMIADPRIAVKASKIKYTRSASTLMNSIGCFVVTVFDNASGASNGIGSCYAMDAANMQEVKEFMGDTAVFQQLANYFLGNPLESLFSCVWVPFALASNPGAATYFRVGNQTAPQITCYAISGTGKVGSSAAITIPFRADYGVDFRDCEPYTSATLYLPGVGNIDLNMSDWRDSTKINIIYTMEYSTGDVGYYLNDDNGNMIQTIFTNVGSVCPLGQVTTNGGQAVSSIGGAAGGLATMAAGALTENVGVFAAGGAALLAGAANTALSFNKRAASIKGGTGGRVSSDITSIEFTGYYMDTEDCNNANYIAQKGRPVALTHAISNHSGFVQCDDASVSIAGDAWERDEVNAFLNGGFFYE